MTNNPDWWTSLLGRSSLEAVSERDLTELVEKYPFFPHAHWWLARKTQEEASLQKAAAYAFYPRRLREFVLRTPEESPVAGAANPRPAETAVSDAPIPSPSSTPAPAGSNETQVMDSAPAGEGEPVVSDVIQPLFTQDYFAYTGTRLPEVVDNDKKPTMEQLRSFTDWLRALKRPAHNERGTDPDLQDDKASLAARQEQVDSGVLHHADHSNIEEEIYTEAMAEVRLKQGHREKALQIYEKLRLLNPEKNSYFADKINRIKNT